MRYQEFSKIYVDRRTSQIIIKEPEDVNPEQDKKEKEEYKER